MSQQVIDEIIAAFADVPCPTMFSLREDEDWEEGGLARQNLSGKDWREIDATFIHQNKAAFYGLAAEAYQYYLPARMICSLDNPRQFKDVAAYTVLSLRPNLWYLMYEGKDEELDYECSLLTDQQRYTVCSFLGVMFEEPYNYTGWSARYLKWGWNIPTHPACIKVRDYYHSLHNFVYPPAISEKNRELIELIQEAFKDTPRPTSIFNRESFEKAILRGQIMLSNFRVWTGRPFIPNPNFVSWHEGALHFFSDEELRYFLPAFLIADIWMEDQGENDREDIDLIGSNGNPVFTLTFGLTSPRRQGSRDDRFSSFTFIERQAVIAYLKSQLFNDYHRADINNAIENYWSKTV